MIALFVAENMSNINLEIGVSKDCVILCQEFMQSFALKAHIQVLVSRYQGKIHSG
jgi:hypothetical protein